MKFKLVLKLGLLSAAFAGMIEAQGRALLSLEEINERKQSYFKSKSYKSLSPEIKFLVDKYLFETINIDGDLYRLIITNKGKGRETESTLRCVVNGKMKTISQVQTADSKFNDWIKYQAFDSKGQWIGAKTVGDITSLIDKSTTSVVTPSSSAIYTHRLKPNIELLKAEQVRQGFYKKLLDGLSAGRNISTQNSQLVAQAATQFNAQTAQSVSNAFNSTVSNTSAVASKSASSLVRMAKYTIPGAAVTGAAALAYKYGFKSKAVEPEEQPASYMKQFSNYCTKNPGTTISTAATIVALGYGAYKLYNSEISADSKKEITKA